MQLPHCNAWRTPLLMSVVSATVWGCGGCASQDEDGQCREICRLDLGKGREMLFFVDRSWEVSQGLYYRVASAKRVIPMTFVGSLDGQPEGLQLRAVSAPGSSLFGVVDDGKPSVVLVLHDFASGDSWPHDTVGETKERLIRRLAAEHPKMRFVADDDALP